mgnify:CR=1 FL=1
MSQISYTHMAGEMLIQVYETGADFMHTFLPDNLAYSIEIIFEYQKFLIETLQNLVSIISLRALLVCAWSPKALNKLLQSRENPALNPQKMGSSHDLRACP